MDCWTKGADYCQRSLITVYSIVCETSFPMYVVFGIMHLLCFEITSNRSSLGVQRLANVDSMLIQRQGVGSALGQSWFRLVCPLNGD